MTEMKRQKGQSVAIITFHASHNYGSMLQAYALQNVVKNLGYHCEIINFRTERQKNFYKPVWKQGSLYERFKRFIISLPKIKEIRQKSKLFEEFLVNDLQLSSKEYSTLDELYSAHLDYDYVISGSDQIWNTLILDFDWAYFLPYINKARKIAYASSMGPTPELTTPENASKIKRMLNAYDSVSLREKRTSLYLKELTGIEFPVVLDPTLLLSRDVWDEFAGEEPLISGDYCFCYSPWMNEDVLKMAVTWATQHHMPVVVSKPFVYLSSMLKWRNVIQYIPVGPKEFLNLCKNARMVYCDSFHSVVFSIFFKVPFFAFKGMEDARIANILSVTELTNRSVTSNQYINSGELIDFDFAMDKIAEIKNASYEWLKSVLSK